MKTKKWLLGAALATVALGAGQVTVRFVPAIAWAKQAQSTGNPYRAAIKARLDALTAPVNLSPEQKQTIGRILREAFPKGRALAHDEKMTPVERRQKLAVLRETTRGRITQVLTPTQRTAAQKLFVGREQRVKQALGEVADELDLTDKQRVEARPIVESAFKQGRAIMQNSALSFPQKRAKLLQLKQSTQEKLASILTAEQMRKANQMRDAALTEIMSRAAQFGLPAGMVAELS